LIGSWLSGVIVQNYTLPGGGHDWRSVWIVPAAGAFGVLILFALLFKPEPTTTKAVTDERLGAAARA
jgi:hypothetical protein